VAVSQSVRLARTSDVDDIAAVQRRAWQHDFAGLLPESVLESLDVADLALQWGRALLAGESHRVFVAVAEGSGDVVGAASVGPASDTDLEGLSVGEIGVLFVDPDHQRRGHGSRLMHACVDMIKGARLHECVTWIALDDAPRRAFFTSAGWGPDSAYRDLQMAADDEPLTIREVRLVTRVE
jgi:GNAT superfamily N-acetyltransferase